MNLLTKIGQLLSPIRADRRIKDVDEWSGSASNYDSAESFARSSLLNFNPVAGRGDDPDNWTKSLIKLPIREEGDDRDVYVRQAVFAAAGGRGITAVVKPEDVSQADFDRLMTAAADEIIQAYGEMDLVAPESVYEIAGMEMPDEERAIPLYEIWEEIWDALMIADMAEDTYSYLIDVYMDIDEFGRKQLFAIVVRDGEIYKVDFDVSPEGDVVLNSFNKIEITAQQRGGTVVFRQADGSYRWLCIAATSALNRVGEIDSTDLFDSFIGYIRETGQYPILNFYHQGKESRLGIADYVARDGFTYIASGTFDNNKFGIAAAEGIKDDPDYWGNSIEFTAFARELMAVRHDDITAVIPVFTSGINTAISILPESQAAAWGTAHLATRERGGTMEARIKTDLTKLFGDETIADEFEELVDGVNRQVGQMVHRSNEVSDSNVIEEEEEEVLVEEEATTEVENELVVEEVEEEAEEVEAAEVQGEAEEVETPVHDTPAEIVLDETFVPGIAQDLLGYDAFVDGVRSVATRVMSELVENLNQERERVAQLEVQLATVLERLAVLEQTEESRRERWQEDRPENSPAVTVVSYRPRNSAQETEPQNGQASLQDVAQETLRRIYQG